VWRQALMWKRFLKAMNPKVMKAMFRGKNKSFAGMQEFSVFYKLWSY
jgi:hypothetical protein